MTRAFTASPLMPSPSSCCLSADVALSAARAALSGGIRVAHALEPLCMYHMPCPSFPHDILSVSLTVTVFSFSPLPCPTLSHMLCGPAAALRSSQPLALELRWSRRGGRATPCANPAAIHSALTNGHCPASPASPAPPAPPASFSRTFASNPKLHLPPLEPRFARLAQDVLDGNLHALSRAITLCESVRESHRPQAAALLQHVLEAVRVRKAQAEIAHGAGKARDGIFKIGITGPPGAGKSSLIERLGMHAVEDDRRVAVLAIDPSSHSSGGSILGDKTRMERLSAHPSAFIRPTPSRGEVGGLARNTADAALLCEASGCDVLLVETVGGGQADVAVAQITDMVLLLLPPAGGDELQGIKKGVVEIADLVVVNKADGAMEGAALAAVGEYSNALHFVHPRYDFWMTPVSSGRWADQVLAVSLLEYSNALHFVHPHYDFWMTPVRCTLCWWDIPDSLSMLLMTWADNIWMTPVRCTLCWWDIPDSLSRLLMTWADNIWMTPMRPRVEMSQFFHASTTHPCCSPCFSLLLYNLTPLSMAALLALQVVACSTRTGLGIEDVWKKIGKFQEAMRSSGELQQLRGAQNKALLWSTVEAEILYK
ncbi:unnamed protein product [Closterium sp. NIES-54]